MSVDARLLAQLEDLWDDRGLAHIRPTEGQHPRPSVAGLARSATSYARDGYREILGTEAI